MEGGNKDHVVNKYVVVANTHKKTIEQLHKENDDNIVKRVAMITTGMNMSNTVDYLLVKENDTVNLKENLETVAEALSQIKRRHTEKHPALFINPNAVLRNKIVSFFAEGENGRRTMAEYGDFCKKLEEDTEIGRRPSRSWLYANKDLVKRVEVGDTTYLRLTSKGKRIHQHLSSTNESVEYKTGDKVIVNLSKALIDTKGTPWDGKIDAEITNVSKNGIEVSILGGKSAGEKTMIYPGEETKALSIKEDEEIIDEAVKNDVQKYYDIAKKSEVFKNVSPLDTKNWAFTFTDGDGNDMAICFEATSKCVVLDDGKGNDDDISLDGFATYADGEGINEGKMLDTYINDIDNNYVINKDLPANKLSTINKPADYIPQGYYKVTKNFTISPGGGWRMSFDKGSLIYSDGDGTIESTSIENIKKFAKNTNPFFFVSRRPPISGTTKLKFTAYGYNPDQISMYNTFVNGTEAVSGQQAFDFVIDVVKNSSITDEAALPFGKDGFIEKFMIGITDLYGKKPEDKVGKETFQTMAEKIADAISTSMRPERLKRIMLDYCEEIADVLGIGNDEVYDLVKVASKGIKENKMDECLGKIVTFPDDYHIVSAAGKTGVVISTFDDSAVVSFEDDATSTTVPLADVEANIDMVDVENIEEAISPEQRKEITDFSKKLKNILTKKCNLEPKVQTSGSVSANPYISAFVRSGPEFSPEMRNAALDAIYGASFVRDKENPRAGNIEKNSMTMAKTQWEKFLTAMNLSESVANEDSTLPGVIDKAVEDFTADLVDVTAEMRQKLKDHLASLDKDDYDNQIAWAQSGNIRQMISILMKGEDINSAITESKADDIALPNSNLYLIGGGMDNNGNAIVRITYPNDNAFSIQTNGVLKETNRLLGGSKDISGLSEQDLANIEKEVVGYIQAHGSGKQKSKLKIYNN